MYRRQRMLAKMAGEQDVLFPQSQFVTRVTSLPVVHSAIEYASDGYGRIKGMNGIIKVALTQAERSLKFAAEQAKPAVQKLEKPINFADNLACSGLDKLEQKLPVIKKSPEEIAGDTKKIYESTVQGGFARYQEVRKLGTQKVRALADYGVNKAYDALQTPYGQLMLKSADRALSVTENYIDYYLPPLEGEKQKEEMGNKNFAERVETLSSKTKQRMYSHAVTQVNHIQKLSHDALTRVSSTLDLILHAKNLDPRNGLNVALHNVQNKATWLWEELNKEPEEGSQTKSVDQQLLGVARRVTKQLVQSYSAYSDVLHAVPQQIQNRISTGRKYAVDMYNQFAKATRIAELSNAVLKQMQDNISYMQSTVSSLIDAVLRKGSTKHLPVENNVVTANDVAHSSQSDAAATPANDIKANDVHPEKMDTEHNDIRS